MTTPATAPEAASLVAHNLGRHIALHRDCPRCEALYNRVVFVASPVPLASAAEYLGVDPASLRQAIARGTLQATRIGTAWVVELHEVARWERERNARARAITERTNA